MKVGYTPAEAYQMFRPLRREVFDYFGYEHPLSFGVRSPKTGIFTSESTIAHCNFSDNPDTPWSWGKRITEFASGIRVNATYLPHLYEDELRNILLHELCHATAGMNEAHGDRWQQQAREVGAIPLDTFLIRNWKSVVAKGHPFYPYAERMEGPTMDIYSESL